MDSVSQRLLEQLRGSNQRAASYDTTAQERSVKKAKAREARLKELLTQAGYFDGTRTPSQRLSIYRAAEQQVKYEAFKAAEEADKAAANARLQAHLEQEASMDHKLQALLEEVRRNGKATATHKILYRTYAQKAAQQGVQIPPLEEEK